MARYTPTEEIQQKKIYRILRNDTTLSSFSDELIAAASRYGARQLAGSVDNMTHDEHVRHALIVDGTDKAVQRAREWVHQFTRSMSR